MAISATVIQWLKVMIFHGHVELPPMHISLVSL